MSGNRKSSRKAELGQSTEGRLDKVATGWGCWCPASLDASLNRGSFGTGAEESTVEPVTGLAGSPGLPAHLRLASLWERKAQGSFPPCLEFRKVQSPGLTRPFLCSLKVAGARGLRGRHAPVPAQTPLSLHGAAVAVPVCPTALWGTPCRSVPAIYLHAQVCLPAVTSSPQQ